MAKVEHKDVGDLWPAQATFTVGGVNTDPTNLTVRQQDPAGTETVLLNNALVSGLTGSSTPVAKTATGIFKLNPGISLNTSGHWYVRFEGTGAATAAEEIEAIVDPSEFTSNAGVSDRALVSLAEVKDWLNQNNIDTGEDLELVRLINAISARFHQEARREFKVRGTNPQTRTFPIRQRGTRMPYYVDFQYVGEMNSYNKRVEVGDMAAVPATVQIINSDWVTVAETVSSGDIYLVRDERDPISGPIRALEFADVVTSLGFGMRVNVTGSWGFPLGTDLLENAKQAVLDGIMWIRDRDVEHYSTDLAPTTASGGANVVVVGNAGPRVVSLPPPTLAVAWYFRDPVVG